MTDRPTVPTQPSALITSADELTAVRESMGLSLADVAQRLKLHPKQLSAIEAGDWNALPGKSFVRGSVRGYARLLGVDAEPLLKTIGGFEPVETLKPSPSLDRTMPSSSSSGFGFDGDRRSKRWLWALLGLAGVIGLALFFGGKGDSLYGYRWSLSPPAKPAAQPSTPGPSVEPPQQLVQQPAAPAADVLTPTPGVVLGDPQAQTVAPTIAGPASGPDSKVQSAVAKSGAQVRLSVKQDAWVEIKDANGKVLQFGLVKGGQTIELSGKAPYVYTIGNANQASLEFEGREIDLKPTTMGTSNIAKGTLQ